MTGFFKKLFNRITGRQDEPAPPPEPEVEARPPPEPEAPVAPEIEPPAAVPERQPEPAPPEPEPAPPEPEPEPTPPEPEPIEAPRAAEPPAITVAADTAIEEVSPPKDEPPATARPAPRKPEPKAKARIEPPKKAEPEKPKPRVEAKPVAKKPEAKKPEPTKVEAKKAEPKKPEPKKPEPKKPEPEKPAAKKVEAERPQPRPVAKVEEPATRIEKKAPAPPEPVEIELPKPEPLPASEPEIIAEPSEPVAEDIRALEAEKPPLDDGIVAEPQPSPREEPAPEPEISSPPVRPHAEQRREAVPEPQIESPQPRGGWFGRLKQGLAKSSRSLTGSITAIFTKRKLDAATLEELEDVLIQADLGLEMTTRIVKAVSAGRYDKEIEPSEVKAILASEVAKVLKPVEIPFNFGEEKPFVILVVGVNGSGKTTTIGKLGAIATGEGFSVMLAACDTFRAAAIEQLAIWGKRIGAKVISRPTGADAAGLAFDAMKEAKADQADILIVDTAGRLQNKANLMAELDKIVRVIKKQDETAPHAVLLVLDATTGQNAISQADVFTKVAGVTGLIMTKLDGTARGGILVAIAERFKLPIHAIGVGEQIEDLQPFDADAFSRAIAGLEE